MVAFTPRREELHQIRSDHNREPQWPFGTKAEAEYWSRREDRERGFVPHGTLVPDHHRDVHGKFNRDPQWTMPPRRFERAQDYTPSPAEYQRYAPRYMRKSPVGGGFGSKTPRGGVPGHDGAPLHGTASPGPSAYDVRVNLGSHTCPGGSVKYSLGGRPTSRQARTPGPTDYRPRTPNDARVPRWADTQQRPSSAEPRPIGVNTESKGPESHKRPSDLGRGGVHWSMAGRASTPRGDQMPRKLGANYTQFGHHGK